MDVEIKLFFTGLGYFQSLRQSQTSIQFHLNAIRILKKRRTVVAHLKVTFKAKKKYDKTRILL